MPLRKYFLTIAVLISWIATSPAEPSSFEEPGSSVSEGPPLLLGLGEQRLLRVDGLKRFSIGGPQIRALSLPASASRSSETLLIKAVQPGAADLLIWRENGASERRKIRVEKTKPLVGLKPELLHGLSELNETEILFAGTGVALRGEIHTLAECSRIEMLERNFPDSLRNETQVSEGLLERSESALLKWIQNSPWRDQLRLERRDQALWLSGNVPASRDLEPVRRRARGIFPAIRLDLQSLPDDSPTVHFQVYLLEVHKNRFGSLGLAWPPNQAGAFRVTTEGIQDLLQLDLTIQMLEGEGAARVLSKPQLVVRAPGDAELFSGGELPIQTQSHYYSNVTWKNFGLTLRLKVTHTTAEKVRLEIFTEVSHLDSTIATDAKVPGLQANRMRTQVDARYGTPLLLSGLLQQGMRKKAKGLPLLREIPVIGALFGSEDWLNDKSELVAILLPSASPPRAPNPSRSTSRLPPPAPVPPRIQAQEPPPPEATETSEAAEPDRPWKPIFGEGRGEVFNE